MTRSENVSNLSENNKNIYKIKYSQKLKKFFLIKWEQ